MLGPRHHHVRREADVAELIYSAITSLDGYVADEEGNFDWAAPDDEVHAFVNDLERPIGTYLYGRRMYDVMRYWENAHTVAGQPFRDYAELWQAADKVVYSKTLQEATTARTRIERDFDPQAIREMKASADRDLLRFVAPIVVGGGTRWLPGGVRIELELVDERRFGGGVAFLRYRMKP
jgi:dihydrofolate reductase